MHRWTSLAVVLLVTMSAARADARRIKFAHGASSAIVSGSVTGDRSEQWVFGARAGQTLKIDFRPAKPMLYYNVRSGAGLMRNSSVEGNDPWTTTLPTDGDYTIDVYFMRAEARRGTKSDYQLTTTITAGGSARSASARKSVVRYKCEDGSTLTATYAQGDAGGVTVVAGSTTYQMAQVPAASGAKYSSGTATWWTKGKGGTFELNGVTSKCTE
jgi:membrane-bound inhibitor of C-type lysozyme